MPSFSFTDQHSGWSSVYIGSLETWVRTLVTEHLSSRVDGLAREGENKQAKSKVSFVRVLSSGLQAQGGTYI